MCEIYFHPVVCVCECRWQKLLLQFGGFIAKQVAKLRTNIHIKLPKVLVR